MVGSRSIAGVAAGTLAAAFYFALVMLLLERSTLEVYGFRVAPDPRTVIEIALRACPIVAALLMILISSWRHNVLARLAAGPFARTPAPYVLAALCVSALRSCCGRTHGSRAGGGLSSVAGHLACDTDLARVRFPRDLTLIGTFTISLHALTRRTRLTLLLFALYTIVVVVFGTRWHLTSFIGFASTVRVRLSSYAGMPLYFTAEWLFRYWTR